MDATSQAMPEDVEALKAALMVARAEVTGKRAMAAAARAELSAHRATIALLKLQIEKLRREIYGPRAERSTRLLDQMELQLEELEASATEDELAAERAAAATTVAAHPRKRPSHQPFPEHLPRERVVETAPTTCACCGGSRLAKLGENVTETLEIVPRRWKVIQHVREKFTCRDCESITQAPVPFHVTPRGWAGPHLLAMILFEKCGQHQPLSRQAERYSKEGVPLSLSTLADQVGACAVVLQPLIERIQAHVSAAERLHGDDTTVPVLARGKCDVGRSWVYVRYDRPFGGHAPPAAVYHYSGDRSGKHPREHLAGWTGILQADAYGGYGQLYDAQRAPAPIAEAACWAHLWMPPLLQEASEPRWRVSRLHSSIRPTCGEHPASPAVMVRSADRAQSRETSSKLGAPSGLLRFRLRRSPSIAQLPSRRVSRQDPPAESRWSPTPAAWASRMCRRGAATPRPLSRSCWP